MKEQYNKTILSNGIRVITERLDHVRSISLGIAILVGTKHESPYENGISHFLEHILFKGTKKRTAKQIAQEIEGVGGEVNAYTSKEFTYFYARLPSHHLHEIWDVLADILTNEHFNPTAIELEKRVVGEEIKSFLDSPSDQTFFGLDQLLYPGHPLSRPILGEWKVVSRLKGKQLVEFKRKYYTADRIIVAAAGAVEHNELVDLVDRYFNKLTPGTDIQLPELPPYKPRIFTKKQRDISQVHVAIGNRTFPYASDERHPLVLGNAILGGTMSSRLFQRLRESEALVYTVSSYLEFYCETGSLEIYFATTPRNVVKSLNSIREEMLHLHDNLQEDELQRIKNYVTGGLIISSESTVHRMRKLMRDEIYEGKYVPLDEVIAKFKSIKMDDVLATLDKYLQPDQFSISAVGAITPKDAHNLEVLWHG
ncbi:insulinase family protein [candidate division WOR-3 bacterium]|nr:insulinase family protein [candidate division WOR-3 bacterium]